MTPRSNAMARPVIIPRNEDFASPSGEATRHHRIWRQANIIKKVSDRWVGFGPFGIGMDTFLAFIPGAGVAYSVGAGGL